MAKAGSAAGQSKRPMARGGGVASPAGYEHLGVQTRAAGPFLRLNRVAVTENIVDQVRGLVTSRQLRPGDRLPAERELASLFGVSRASLRESLKVLAATGWVDIRHGAGVYLTQPQLQPREEAAAAAGPTAALQILEVRRVVDTEVAALAAERASDEDLAAIERELRRADTPTEHVRRSHCLDLTFEQLLAQATANDELVAAQRAVLQRFTEIWTATGQMPRAVQERLRDHWRIYAAVRDRQPEEAREAMRRHLDLQRRQTGAARPSASEGRSPS